MKKFRYIILFFAFLAFFLAGSLYSKRMQGGSQDAAGRRILYYIDPMNPSHTSDKPGLAPCGMKLEPVYADEGSDGAPSDGHNASLPLGSVKISPAKQQLIGVQTQQAEVSAGSHTLRLLGRVAADEDRISRILAVREGYMDDLRGAVPTGTMVQKGQLLAAYYNTDSQPTQQAYIYALNAAEQGVQDEVFAGRLGASRKDQLRQAEDNLKYYGVEAAQIAEIARTRQVSNYIELRSPITGFIMARNIFPNSRFERDNEFFRIVDLSRVWIYADVYENEEEYIKPGAMALVSLPGRSKVFQARVSDTLHPFDSNSRTYRARLEVANPDFILRPDAFVDIELQVQMPPALTVPMEAVLDSGSKKVVFVDRGNGYFEPRQVETGWSFGDRVEIKQGLMPDERIVTSGGFLIDSESRMRLAASAALPQEGFQIDPVCRMPVAEKEAKGAGHTSERDGKTYYFCSPACKEQFEAHTEHNPRDSSQASADQGHSSHAAPMVKSTDTAPGPSHQQMAIQTDPVCGERLVPEEAKAEGRTSQIDGTTYYFFSNVCKQVFDAHSSYFLEKLKEDSHSRHQKAPSVSPMERSDHGAQTATEPKAVQVDPVCGEAVEPKAAEAAGLFSEVDTATYYFSSGPCKEVFDEHTRHFLKQMKEEAPHQESTRAPASSGESSGHESQAHHEGEALRVDPVCGEEVDPKEAEAAGRTSVYNGATYHFCSDLCKQSFDKEPTRWLH